MRAPDLCQRWGKHGELNANNFLRAAYGLTRNDRKGVEWRGSIHASLSLLRRDDVMRSG